jgi:hypothetical protein
LCSTTGPAKIKAFIQKVCPDGGRLSAIGGKVKRNIQTLGRFYVESLGLIF